MLTARSSILLGLSAAGLVGSLLDRNEPLALLSLSVLIWIWIEWFSFQRFKVGSGPLFGDCSRTIDGQSEGNVTLVADREVKIRLQGKLSWFSRGYRFLVHDMIPDTLSLIHI